MSSGSRLRPWLARVGLDLRPGEGELAAQLCVLHGLLLTFQYVAKSVRQSTFIDSLGAEQLPWVYLLVAFCSYPLLAVYGRLVDRFSQRALLALTSLVSAGVLLVFWGLFSWAEAWVTILFYLWVAIIGVLQVSQFWAYALQRLDARQSRRLFGLIGAGGILGSIVGGQIARFASTAFSTYAALPIAAGVLALSAALLARPRHGSQPMGEPGSAPPERAGAEITAAQGGWSVVRNSPYLRLLALLMLLMTMVSEIVDLQFGWAVEQNTVSLGERTAVYGNLFSVMGLAALVFQLLATAYIHRRWGVGLALRVLPATNAATSTAFLTAAALFPHLVLPVAWVLKVGESGLRYSLDQVTRELLFQPVAPADRSKAKAFIDVFVQRAATGLAALALLSVSFGWLSVANTAYVSLGLVAIWLALVGKTRMRYVASFRHGLLRSGADEERRLDLGDAATLELLVEGLGSDDPREVLHSLELLDANGRGRLVPPLMLHHPDPAVRTLTVEVLRRAGRCDTACLAQACLADPEPEVRAAATRALASASPSGLAGAMVERLRDPDVRIRAAAVAYLAGLDDPEVRERADFALEEMAADGDPVVRAEAARALSVIPDPIHRNPLVRLLYDNDPKVVRAAIEAVGRRTERGARNPLYIPILVSHLRNRRLKHDARKALVGYGEEFLPALGHFLCDPQEGPWVRRALPKTIASIGGEEALETLVRGLRTSDAFLRRKVIEALVSLHAREPECCPERPWVESEIAVECRAHLAVLLELWSLCDPELAVPRGGVISFEPGTAPPHLLLRLLADRLDSHQGNLFRLLSLIHPMRDVRAAQLSLASESPRLRAHAIEYLDNVLKGETKPAVLAVIDDLPVAERRRLAEKLFGLESGSVSEVLERRIAERDGSDAAWLKAAAMHFICERRLSSLYPGLRRAAKNDPDPLVQETTAFLLPQIAGKEKNPSP